MRKRFLVSLIYVKIVNRVVPWRCVLTRNEGKKKISFVNNRSSNSNMAPLFTPEEKQISVAFVCLGNMYGEESHLFVTS